MPMKRFPVSLSLLFLALCQTSKAQYQETSPATVATNAANGIYSVGNGTTPPSVTYKIDPGYSRMAQRLRAQGAVGFSIVVGQDGVAQDIRVIKPLGYGLDEKATEAVQKWRFTPGTNKGQPVRVRAQIQVNFRLDRVPGYSSWYSGQITFAKAENLTSPEVTDGEMPEPDKVMSSESAIFEFTVTTRGAVTNIRATHGSQSSTELLARSLAKWKFRPAMQGVQPVEATGIVRFVKGEGDAAVNLVPVSLPPAQNRPNAPPDVLGATLVGHIQSLDGRLRSVAEKDLVLEVSSGRLLRFRLLQKTEFRDRDGRPVRDSLMHPGDDITVGVNPDDPETAIYIIALKSASNSEREAASASVEPSRVATPDSSDFGATTPR